MPYIAVNVSKVLSEQEKDTIKAGLGESISLIPSKSEKSLMVDIADGRAMYFGGEKRDTAYLDVKAFGTTELSDQKTFVEAAFDVMERVGFQKKNVYITMADFPNWGVRGTLA